MNFREWLKKIRENYGLSQEQMADCLKVSLSTLRSWEQGRASAPGYYQYLLNRYYVNLVTEYIEQSADRRDLFFNV